MDHLPQDSKSFSGAYAKIIANTFNAQGVDYLFIGKSGAIILGFPGTTQDLDLFLPKFKDNAQKVVSALRGVGFNITPELEKAILQGKDFIQIKDGPFQLDLIHAPDGIKDYQTAKVRYVLHENLYPVASLQDIIASKQACGRVKDLIDLELLREFRKEYERMNPKTLQSTTEKVVSTKRRR